MAPGLYKLKTRIKHYHWGSRHFLAELRGAQAPTACPEAELWIGTHPLGASDVEINGAFVPLADLIAEHPQQVLGREVAASYQRSLPFLLKILAVDEPLSIQLHPNRSQAAAGFAGEDPGQTDPRERNYQDPRHKPELAVALTAFSALRGLRPVAEVLELFDRAAIETLRPEIEALRTRPDEFGLRRFLGTLFELEEARVAAALDEGRDAVARFEPEPIFRWMGRLLDVHPGDIGCLATLFLHLVRIEPGEALFQPPGMLHCYLKGAAVEVMADSDNVLRAALTPKRVDVPELMKLLVVESGERDTIKPENVAPGLSVYSAPVGEFNLSRLELDDPRGDHRSSTLGRIQIWVCTKGDGRIAAEDGSSALTFRAGESFLVPAAVGSYVVRGRGVVFGVSVP